MTVCKLDSYRHLVRETCDSLESIGEIDTYSFLQDIQAELHRREVCTQMLAASDARDEQAYQISKAESL